MAEEFTPDQIKMIRVLGARDDLTPEQQQMVSVLMQRIDAPKEKPKPKPVAEAPAKRAQAAPQPWAKRTDQPLTDQPFREIGRYALGAGEAALGGISKGAGMIASGVGGLARLATGAGVEKAAETMREIEQKPVFGFEPRTKTGQVVGQFAERATSAPLEPALRAYGGLTDVAAGAAGRLAGPTTAGIVGAGMQALPVAAAELAGFRGAGRIGRGKFVRQGKPTPQFEQALERHGIDYGEIGPEGKRLLETEAFETPDQAARAAFMQSQGLQPTRAQVTRKKSEMITQQELAKETNQISGRLETQNALLKSKFDQAADLEPQIPGELRLKDTTGTPAYDRILDRVTVHENKMFDMYQKAREKSAGREIIRPQKLIEAIKRFEPDNDLTNGLVKGIEGVAKNRGFYDPKTGKITRNITTDEAEGIVQSINKRYKKTGNANANRIGRKIKDAIDLDVAKYTGENAFKLARQEKARMHRDLRPGKKTSWTKRDVSLVEDLLNETIDPKDVLTKGILGTKYRPNEIKHLKQYLNSGTEAQKAAGKKAWKDLKAEAIEFIRDEAFQGPVDAKGNRTISRASFQRAVKKFGDMEKLKSFFDPQEVKFLRDMQKTLEIIEPPGGTFLGEGPTARAVNRRWQDLSRRMGKFDIFKGFENAVLDPEGKALKMPATRLKPRQEAAALAAGTAAAMAMENNANE